ncbi:MAG: hypothetical protein AB1540_10905 [Bdellovibrionota bacterium]
MKSLLLGFVFVCVYLSLTIPYVVAAGSHESSLQKELIRLDRARREKSLSQAERLRLAEIFFLTSRCEDVRKLLSEAKQESELLCACGAGCQKGSSLEKLARFRSLVDEKRAAWRSKPVQTLWKSLKHKPEAQYWALKALRRERDPKWNRLRVELEQSLSGLEISSGI